jgi:hypothetical protein
VIRLARLGQVAAQAEILRLRAQVGRGGRRLLLVAVAGLFLLATLALLHAAVLLWLAPRIGLLGACLVLAAFDAVVTCVLLLFAARDRPGRTEREAMAVRDQALAGITDSAARLALGRQLLMLVLEAIGRYRRR